MADHPRLAATLALVGGIVTLGSVLLILLVGSIFLGGALGVATSFEWEPWFLGPFSLLGIVATAWAFLVLVSATCGILLLVAASRMRSGDAEKRKAWATYALVAGIGAVVLGGGILGGGLGIAAGVVGLAEG